MFGRRGQTKDGTSERGGELLPKPVPIPPRGRIELDELPFPEPDKREELPVTDPVDEGPLSKVDDGIP